MDVATHWSLKGLSDSECSGKSGEVEYRDKWSLVSVIARVKRDSSGCHDFNSELTAILESL